jgi:transposase
VDRDLRRHKHLTLKLVWGEYIQAHPDGCGFTQFCAYFRRWRRERGRTVTLRQEHRPGAALQVDYAGDTVVVMDAGEAREAQIFVACLPFSGLIYAEATWTQRVEDWLSSHVRAFTAIGGVAAALVPDNLKSGVTRANFFDPVLNASYYELARHYGTAVLPARPRKPRDKPAVENAVLQVERWILAPLRHRTFFGLDELNAAIAPLCEALNNRPLSPPREGTRRSVFEAEERALLRPLPAGPYVVGQWDLCRAVGADYPSTAITTRCPVPWRTPGSTCSPRRRWCRSSSAASGPPAQPGQGRPHHAARAHAAEPSRRCGADARAPARRGGGDRRGHGDLRRPSDRQPPTRRTGSAGGWRRHSPVRPARRRRPGEGVRAGAGGRRPVAAVR